MAVYKPTYCYPYLEAVDLAIPDGEKYFTCQIDTSNIGITGYRVELYDEENNLVFPNESNRNKISPLSEIPDLGDTMGLNSSELRFPFIQQWNRDSKIYSSYNAIYCTVTGYVNYYQQKSGSVPNLFTAIGPLVSGLSSGQTSLTDDEKKAYVGYFVKRTQNTTDYYLRITEDNYTSVQTMNNGGETAFALPAVVNEQLYVPTNPQNTNTPFQVDNSYIFVGDTILLDDYTEQVDWANTGGSGISSVNGFYVVTERGLQFQKGFSSNTVIYVKGGETNASKILKLDNGNIIATTDSVWCDVTGSPLNLSNEGKTYKWQITLYSGEKGMKREADAYASYVSYDDLADNEFDTFLTSGTILGSTVDRIQGPISDKIYAKQWLQLLNAEGEQIGQRTLIDSYSQSLGHIYPATGSLRSFTNDNLYSDTADQSSIATQFEIYKYSNNPDNLVGQEKIEHSINFSMMSNGAAWDGNYQYVVEGYENISKFNNACGTVYPQLCQFDANGQALYVGQQVLIWNITIVDQDLTAEGFIPINNTYYRHTGATTEAFEQGQVYLCVISYGEHETVNYVPYTNSQNPVTGIFTISYVPPVEGEIEQIGVQELVWPRRILPYYASKYNYEEEDGHFIYRLRIRSSVLLPDTASDIKLRTGDDSSSIELTSTNTLIGTSTLDTTYYGTTYRVVNNYYARVEGNSLYLTTEGVVNCETRPDTLFVPIEFGAPMRATVSYMYLAASPPKFVFDMIYSYRKVSAYIGKVFFINSGPFAGRNIISEASAGSTNDVVELGVPIVFKQEEPLEIYPTATVPTSKTRGEIYKNNVDRASNVGTVYVSPFAGLSAGARLYVADGSVIQATNVDTVSWSVTYEASEGAVAYSSIEPLKYEIRTNFKASDELPFYAYDTPQAIMWSEEALEVKDNSGHTFLLEFEGRILTVSVGASSNVHNRFVKVAGQYLQSQNVSWTNYRWLLVDQNGDVIQDTGKKYGGSIQTIFYGLQGPTIEEVEAGTAEPTVYYIILMIEDELNNSLITAMKINVSLDLANLAANFNGVFDCKTHSVELEIVPHSNSRNDQKVYSIYKKEDVEGITYYSPVAINIRVDAAEGKAVVRDFNVATGHKYKYIVYAAVSTDGGSVSTVQSTAAKELSETISPDWDCWSLTELVPTTITTESPAIKKAYTADTRNVWLFKYDVESGEQTQNISKTEQKTLGQFPRFAHGRQNNISSSVSCYLGSEIINLGCLPENEKIPYAQGYVERLPWKANLTTNQKVAMLQEWRKIVASKNPKLIKDRKGQAFIVQVTSGSNKPTDNIGYQPDKINFSWTQIASLDDTIITGNK